MPRRMLVLCESTYSGGSAVEPRGSRAARITTEVPVKWRVALYTSEEGVAVCAPSLPGCWSQGATEEEALLNIAEAIREYLEAEIEPTEGTEVREIEVIL